MTTNLSRDQIRDLRGIGHNLKPVVMMGGSGLTDGIVNEITRALKDHELIKIKVMGDDRAERKQVIEQITETTGAELVQNVGKMALLYKKNPQANPKLSNIARYSF